MQAKKALTEKSPQHKVDATNKPIQDFTEAEFREQWFKYADRLNDKGHLIMESLMRISEPKLDQTTVYHELPNEGSKLDFERDKIELVTFLRGKLHNHDIQIITVVNEAIESKKAFTEVDKYARLKEINPAIEQLRKLFDLEF
ncbi:MAG: hypothetical protein CFE24_03065 [Flavobacterium sp. BFFFF2]|nr:MAG: hypothetical protein CFE24_03065 [Flavobacterium sp. BFFFF2]